MPRHTPRTKIFTTPVMIDRFPPAGNPPDGYVMTFSSIDGYWYPKATSKLQIISSPTTSPYNVVNEDVVLVQSHSGTFTVNLPLGMQAGYKIFIKDFAGVATANPINVVAAALIDGATPYVINLNYGAVELIFNGATWSILSKF